MAKSASLQPLPDEKHIIVRAQKGDKEAYRLLVQAYQDRLYRLVFSMVRHRQQAEDLTQEILVKAYFALPSFEAQSAFYSWLFRIGSNHCLDFLRKKRLSEIPLEGAGDEDGERAAPLQTLEAPANEQPDAPPPNQGEVWHALSSLEPEQRLILSLREVEGYSYEELSKMLNCGVNTIKSRLNRAREAFKAVYIRKFGNILT